MIKKNLARLAMVVSAVIFGTLGPVVRNIPLEPHELALYRSVMATLAVGAVLLIRRKPLDMAKLKKGFPLLALSGVAVAINWMLLFEAYRHTTVPVATLCNYFAPALVMALSPLLLKEKLNAKKILCFVMCTIGLVLVIGAGLSGGKDAVGIVFALSSALFFASMVFLNKWVEGIDGLQRTFVQFASAAVVMLPYVAFNDGFHLDQVQGSSIISLLIIGFGHTGLAYCLYFYGLKELPTQQSSILCYIDPLIAMLISAPPLGNEPMSWSQVVGAALLLGFLLYNELPERKRK